MKQQQEDKSKWNKIMISATSTLVQTIEVSQNFISFMSKELCSNPVLFEAWICHASMKFASSDDIDKTPDNGDTGASAINDWPVCKNHSFFAHLVLTVLVGNVSNIW